MIMYNIQSGQKSKHKTKIMLICFLPDIKAAICEHEMWGEQVHSVKPGQTVAEWAEDCETAV